MKKMNLRAWDKRVQAMRRVTRIDFLDGLVYWVNKLRILREVKENVENVELMQSINQQDKNGRELFADDLVKLILPDGEVRIFRIRIKTVDREVRNHQEFVGEYSNGKGLIYSHVSMKMGSLMCPIWNGLGPFGRTLNYWRCSDESNR